MNFLKKIYFKIKYGEPLIVVSGLPRSGTSMIMQMLGAGGLQLATDNFREIDNNNPRGYYELERVKEIDKGGNKSWLKAYKGHAIKIISFLLRDLPLDLNYKVIFISRNIDEVLVSQNKMLIHRGEQVDSTSDEKMKKNYENHLRRVRYLLKNTLNFEVLYIDYRDVIKFPVDKSRQITNYLNNRLDIDAMASVVDSNLYRNRV
jgi:hypothetical protein